METGAERDGADVGRSERLVQVAIGLAVLVAEAVAILVYANRPDVYVTNPWSMVYPIVWIDVSLFVVWRVGFERGVDAPVRRRWIAGALAVVYFVVLAHFGGLFGWFGQGNGLTVDFQLPPGASPSVLYSGSPLVLVLQPYKVLGYATLTYLVYRTVLSTAGSAISGVIGLFSCVSCSWPLIAVVASALFGGGSAVAAAALTHDYLLSTAIFLSSVGLLYWRPTIGSRPFSRLPSP